ncbi:PREDICTED: hsp90 co-chaperone Cdc37 [Vollenhovia emeryi]|uniref:hsp90 co-chaperone Cdc37 n=1 Tax=Vollenhovia emeryi TaxID=411798 RepID=UPI0005F3CD11|nr:PREDICTED: hsp90 co-chaperone Cdc37 [Vollenhovia emeryi]
MVDYSKWKSIEISDDEDDIHPNIDTPSLFRWRHQARLERMEERRKEQEDHMRRKAETLLKLQDTKEKLAKLESEDKESSDFTALKQALQELEKEEKKIQETEMEMERKEKLTPWNIDTIGQDGFTKTVINTAPAKRSDDSGLSDEEKEQLMKQFVKAHEKKLKEFGMLRKYEDSRKFLQEHLYLVCENAANYLVVWCINLEMEEKHNLMEHVAHQCICMQYILELSKQLDVDPRACVGSFFSRIQVAEVEYKNSFDEELRAFKERICKRAAEKVAEAVKEAEEEERQARLGPGGLDPADVFESLPEALQKCFESQDIALLQKTIAAMPEGEATYHMSRCIDSGLWVPDKKSKETKNETKETEEQREQQQSVVGETPDPE